MQRRHYLVAAGAVLLAGCNNADAESSPTATETETQTPTATATDTETATATETDTATQTDTPTPTDEERAATIIAEAREYLVQARDEYLSQGESADTLTDVGPGTVGFNPSGVEREGDNTIAKLEEADGLTTEDQDRQREFLRNATNWLVDTARTQEFMGEILEAVERAREEASVPRSYTNAADSYDDASDEVDDMESFRRSTQDLSLPAFRDIDEIDVEEIEDKDQQIKISAGAFETRLRGVFGRSIDAAEGIEDAEISLEASNYDTAARQARTAKEDLSRAIDAFEDVPAEGFEEVAELYEDAADELIDAADRIIRVAQESR